MPEFRETRPEVIREFIRRHPLGMVCAAGPAGVVATHVPLLIGGEGEQLRLRGHVMRKTTHWEGFKESAEVLVAFTGPDAPVPESWMEHRPFGGTWNYMAVHVRGTLNFVSDAALLEILRDLKNLYEDDPASRFDQLPPDYLSHLTPAIEGFEIVATSVEAVFKLSQNRSDAEHARIVAELRARGGEDALVAEEMAADSKLGAKRL